MDQTPKTLWKEWEVSDALGCVRATFNTLAQVQKLNRRYDNGLFIDRIETLEARDQYGDLIRVRFAVA